MIYTRQGMTPEKNKPMDARTPGNLPVVCVITRCTPHPYHQHRKEITGRCLSSIQNTGRDAYIIIWDNGSTPAYRKWLTDQPHDAIIMTDNIGKQRVERQVMTMFPNNIIAISDDDILYEQRWLDTQIKLMEHFDADMVSGIVSSAYFYETPIEPYQCYNVKPDSVPRRVDLLHAYSVGKRGYAAIQYADGMQSYSVEHDGIRAWIGASHGQYISLGDRLARFIQPVGVMDRLKPRDRAMDAAGMLRITTYEPTAQHMGNALVEESEMR